MDYINKTLTITELRKMSKLIAGNPNGDQFVCLVKQSTFSRTEWVVWVVEYDNQTDVCKIVDDYNPTDDFERAKAVFIETIKEGLTNDTE